jgi:hypothetical protein
MLFGLHVAIPVFGLTDACSKTTQSVQSTALGSQQAMNHTAAMLREMRTDEAFSGYYTSCTTLAEQLMGSRHRYAVLSDRQEKLTYSWILKVNFAENTLRCLMLQRPQLRSDLYAECIDGNIWNIS